MPASAFDSAIYGRLLADETVAALFDDHAQVRAMLRVEAALARAEAAAGVIPAAAADRIAAAAGSLDLEPALLAEGTAAGGVPVTALVAALRAAAGDEAGAWVHWGATSQDIVDTALVLRLYDALALLDQRLEQLLARLRKLAARHARTPMLARTRSQGAVPTTFGLKAALWADPLQRHRTRLAEIRPRLLRAQLGGAAGTRSVLGDAGPAVAAAFARELSLEPAALPWHAQRDGPVELAGWLSLVTGSLAKLGQDVVLLVQTGIEELRVDGGGSSSMPQKNNPVAAEILVALARHNTALLGEMHQALVHAQERDGAAWTSEWLALPQMVVGAGAALARAGELVNAMNVDSGRMAANLAALDGLATAEAATFALVAHMPRPEAERLVKDAAGRVRAEGGHLADHLARATSVPVDWDALKHPGAQIETAARLVEAFLAGAAVDDPPSES